MRYLRHFMSETPGPVESRLARFHYIIIRLFVGLKLKGANNTDLILAFESNYNLF